MSVRVVSASLISVFWSIAEAGFETLGLVGITSTLVCQTAIDVSNALKKR